MTPYADRSGGSGVVAYEDVTDGIAVRFHGGRIYLYTAAGVGPLHLARMLAAARKGSGLATYISRHVHADHAGMFEDATAWGQADAARGTRA